MTLPPEFYARPTIEVARALIGKVLVRQEGRSIVAGRIVETEAYVGEEDLACHASKGRTARTEVMYGPPGRAYVYLIYGMYCCLNVVTEAEGFPAAVLIRAIEPISGLRRMKRNRGRALSDVDIGSGPGKLCQAMGVDRRLNAVPFRGPGLRLEDRGFGAGLIVSSPRIGVDYAGAWRDKPWRFFVEGDPNVSTQRLNRVGTAK